ncbi:unnamed protein product, partial [Anisakis simplex]|uniref:Uncharacterized protein n=1 Tax=Anisakis simplex TaxID=6269 RepID=A0A0M3JIX9_ANISI
MHSQTSVDSSCSAAHQPNSTSMVTCGNLLRMRNTLLGHSDPQISMASSCAAAALTASQLNVGGTGMPNTHAAAAAGGIGSVRLRVS